jgi:hypothetical protein
MADTPNVRSRLSILFGLLIAAYGVKVSITLYRLFESGEIFDLSQTGFWLTVPSAALRTAMIISVGWLVFASPRWAVRIAWLSIAVYILGGAASSIINHGWDFPLHLIPAYYYSIAKQVFVASILTALCWPKMQPNNEPE